MECTIAAVLAVLLTLLDVDRVFYLPRRSARRRELRAWTALFVFGNGALAAGLYLLLNSQGWLPDWQPLPRAALVGFGYLALVHIKFTSISVGGESLPVGLEAFYEAAKAAVYKRINRLAKVARREETLAYAGGHTLAELVVEAKLAATQDVLLSDEERHATKVWILKIVKQSASDPDTACVALAEYILSGDRPHELF